MRLLVSILAALICSASAQDRSQARSMTITQRGIVATAQTLASQAGAQVLARGGSAVDAAIATNAVLGLVEPMMNGIGGDLFALIWDAKTGKLDGINASGWTPKGLTIDFLKKKGYAEIPGHSIHAVSVPGCVRGWDALHKRYGRLPWRDLFAPAIYYAENGFPVTELIQWDWEHSSSQLDEDARRIYFPGGKVPQVGQVFRNPELAHAYRLIAQLGAAAFYSGPIGETILKTSQRLGGTMTADDLREYEPEWVEPISTSYRGWKVSELPPNGQGIGALTMLNIVENFPISDYGPNSADALHVKIEAQKLATQDTRRYVGDPRFATIPVEGLLSKEYAKERAKLIDMQKANCDAQPGTPPAHGNTTYFSVVDKDGNIASWIQSISDIWGSGIAVEGMGFILHDRAGGFVTDPSNPNALAPRKRPYHTIIPAFMEKGSEHIGFGIMRGSNQPQAQMQFVSNVVDYGMNIQAALEAPRFTRLYLGGCNVYIENRVPEMVREELTKRGHDLTVVGDFSGWMGGGQAVLHDSGARVNYGASSPRKDGAAIPEPDPYFSAPRPKAKP
ncbi:MAG TPA: gamma-glutamyltransferase [Bryobacteraceae bacterium]|nr:gamma-glutamyltransferase [Bryobacteraceae bacterium]